MTQYILDEFELLIETLIKAIYAKKDKLDVYTLSLYIGDHFITRLIKPTLWEGCVSHNLDQSIDF
jgi:hypothetical protein